MELTEKTAANRGAVHVELMGQTLTPEELLEIQDAEAFFTGLTVDGQEVTCFAALRRLIQGEQGLAEFTRPQLLRVYAQLRGYNRSWGSLPFVDSRTLEGIEAKFRTGLLRELAQRRAAQALQVSQEWPMIWRFQETPAILSRMALLDETEDNRIRDWIRDSSPVATDFQGFETVQADVERIPESDAVAFLRSFGLGGECLVIWAGTRGLRMRTHVCFTHFFDVWYPGSDDLWVIDEERKWMIECDHHGWLRFVYLGPD